MSLRLLYMLLIVITLVTSITYFSEIIVGIYYKAAANKIFTPHTSSASA